MATYNNLNILIIDDNPQIHRDFIKVLTVDESDKSAELKKISNEMFGSEIIKKNKFPEFHIDTSTQGQEGVERIQNALNKNNPYSLAFVDIRMPPGWDGIETIKHIWETDPDIQIVICTAYSDYTWEETVAELGQRENLLILKKPFDSVAVRQLTCALTKKWQLLKESRDYTSSLEESVKERTHLLEQSLSITRGTLESTEEGILVVDINNRIIDFNHKILEIWNIPVAIMERMNGMELLEYISLQVKTKGEFLNSVKKYFQQGDSIKITKLETIDEHIFEFYSEPYKLNNKISGRILSFRDITKPALLEKEIEHQATHDSLTNLPNRALLLDRLQQALVNAKRNNNRFSVLFLDLDRFKLINDSFGHLAGDQLLQHVSKRLLDALRESDTIARVGGDEFIAIINLTQHDNDLPNIIDRILNAFKKPFKLLDNVVTVSASIGVSVFPQDGSTLDELLRTADTAMYKAKQAGGDHLQLYSTEINKDITERLTTETDIQKALRNNEFILYYQPQIDLTNKTIISVEALIRWQHPNKGLLLPIDFIPIAEETNLIIPIDEWILREACKQNKAWQEMGLPKIRIAVNVSDKLFKLPKFPALVKQILEETQLSPEYLEFQLTE